MTRRLTAILAIIALSGIVANAATVSPSLSNQLFDSTPVSVFNIATDTVFATREYTGVHFVAGADNSTIYVYSVGWVDDSTNIDIVKRTLNATAVASGTAENLADDATLTTSVKSSAAPALFASSLGYFAFVTDSESTATPPVPKLNLNILSGTATSPTTVEITGNEDDAATLTALFLFQEDDVFYFIYSVTDSTTATNDGIYIQGVNATDSTKVYTASSKFASLGSSETVAGLIAGGTTSSNSTTFIATYKVGDKVYSAQVTKSTGAISGTIATLYTDASPSGFTYVPAGVFGSGSTYGVGVVVEEDDGTDTFTSVVVFYNGTNTATNISENFTVPTNYIASRLTGMNYIDGYSILLISSDDSGSGGLESYALLNYFPNGTVNGTQLTVGTTPTPSVFADGNGTLWFGTVSFSDTDDTVIQGYLGKLVGQIYASGNIIASFFALLSLLIAALFTF